jgi:hypothetical protein
MVARARRESHPWNSLVRARRGGEPGGMCFLYGGRVTEPPEPRAAGGAQIFRRSMTG